MEENKGFDCLEEQVAPIDVVLRAPEPLVLGTEAVWAAAEAAGDKEEADSRAASLHSSPAIRVFSLLIELPELAKAAEKLSIGCLLLKVERG